MLRLEIVRLFGAEKNVIKMHQFTGASLGAGDGGGNIGRRKIACTWDMGKQVPAMSEIKQVFSPGLCNMAREILNWGIPHPVKSPACSLWF